MVKFVFSTVLVLPEESEVIKASYRQAEPDLVEPGHNDSSIKGLHSSPEPLLQV